VFDHLCEWDGADGRDPVKAGGDVAELGGLDDVCCENQRVDRQYHVRTALISYMWRYLPFEGILV
jgi:hypothetical protein